MSWSRVVGTALTLVIFTSGLAPVAADERVARLGLGEAAFWGGVRVEESGSSSFFGLGANYTCGSSIDCYDYIIEVSSAGILRVALDSIDGDDYYFVRLFSPRGSAVASERPLYSGELTAPVTPGTWTVRVEARRVREGRFRMRARLETANPRPSAGPRRALLPNLRLLPPFKFTFESASYTPAGSQSGCAEDEIVENLPTRCLRFSLGPANYGDGPLELRYEPIEGLVTRGTIYQRVHYSDGTTKEREAGEFQYHVTHGHFHHAGFGALELLKVTDPKRGRMERAGEGPKQGFCMVPYLIVDWRSFENDPAHTAESNCLETTPATGAHMGLDRGWADIYDWYLSGNYVDFGVNTDGLYVVRSMTDASRNILETNEKDNWGYAYIRVMGAEIEVLERGYGKSPWDPRKLVEPRWLMPTV